MFKVRNVLTKIVLAVTVISIFAIYPTQAASNLPKRIISLSPSATEILYAIGSGKQVIAVDDLSNYPSEAPMTKLSAFNPNVEALLNYKPDLIILNADATKALEVKAAL